MSILKLLNLNKDWRQRRPSLKYDQKNNAYTFSGYQQYKITDKTIKPLSKNLIKKHNLIVPILDKLDKLSINNKINSVIDLGCANMYFGLLCKLRHPDAFIHGVEIDRDYVGFIKHLFDFYKFKKIYIHDIPIHKFDCVKGDIVFALAIIHWIYSCSSCFGSLEKVIEYLDSITNKYIFVEWIDRQDSAIQKFKHLDFNSNLTIKDYTKENFLKYLNSHFKSVEFVGNSTKTREIYFCSKA